MTLVHDAVTRFPSPNDGSIDTTTGDRTFTHTPVGTPAGVIVMVGGNSTTDTVSGVLYGGVAMTPVVKALDANEAGCVQIFHLGSSIPTGAQTVTLQSCIAGEHWATCDTVTAGTTDTAVDDTSKEDTNTALNPTQPMTTTTTTLSFAIIHSGLIAPTGLTAGSGCTVPFSNGADYVTGSRSGQTVRRTSQDAAGTVSIGFAAASDDYGMAAVSIKESGSPPGSAFVPQIVILG